MVAGDVVNAAARIQMAASPNATLVGNAEVGQALAFYRSAGAAFHIRRAEEIPGPPSYLLRSVVKYQLQLSERLSL